MSILLTLTRIVQAAAEADSPVVQVNHIVDGIQRAMDVDVCSLYLSNDRLAMVLVASHGLGDAAVGRSAIPHRKGLVGVVAETRHPVNVIDPKEHPAFYYVPGSREEHFRSFCGVPLIRAGAIIGVLAVQRTEPRKLSEEEEAFLVTLGAQLALVVANWHDWEFGEARGSRVYSGVMGSPGVGIGTAYLCEDLDLFSVIDSPCEDREATQAEWHRLVGQVQTEVRSEQIALGSSLSKEVAGIFDAYIALLADPTLLASVEKEIDGGKDLSSALKAVIHHYAELFMAMDDPYLRARHEDIRQLGNRLYSTWRKGQAYEQRELSDSPIVLVGGQVSVSDIARVPRERLVGIACFLGSSLSHTAVLANGLGVPAVMGLGELKGIQDGDPILVDGNSAKVILNPEPAVISEYKELAASEQQFKEHLQQLGDWPALTVDGQRITLYANSGLMADVTPGFANGAEGLGLYRTEIPFMASKTFPSEEEQVQLYQQVMEAYVGKPVYMRILDIGADKPLPYFPVNEENPALGWRGIRFCLDNISLLITQLRAMLRAASNTENLFIMLPMVSAARELRDFHTALSDTINQLVDEEYSVKKPKVGIMVEVPAAISQLGNWRQYIDFISIGSNDLSQYILAADRNNPRILAAYDHLHPAVLAEIRRIVDFARDLDLPVSLCGEMSSDPAAVALLVGMGIRTFSMSAAQLPRIKWLIRAMNTIATEQLAEDINRLGETAEIREFVNAYLKSLELPGIPR